MRDSLRAIRISGWLGRLDEFCRADYLAGPEIRRGRLQTILDDYEPLTGFGRQLYACYTPSRVRLPKVRVFLEELERQFTPLPPWENFRSAKQSP